MRNFLNILLAVVMIFGISTTGLVANAADSETITIRGLYLNPNTGIIEDSGGENSFALGQSMVENMMSTEAILSKNPDGGYYLTFDFNLYNYISDIEFQVQNQGETNYTDITYEIVEEQEERVTLKVPVEHMDSLLRASCHVIPMGRSVVFYIVYSDTFDDGIVYAPAEEGGLTADDVIEDSNIDTTVESTNTSNTVPGITLSSGLSSNEEVLTTETDTNLDIIIDGSFWVLLFVLVFSTNIITGILLLAGYTYYKKSKIMDHDLNVDLELEEEDEDNMLNMDSFGFEVDEDEEI